jgi:hypothetical protein
MRKFLFILVLCFGFGMASAVALPKIAQKIDSVYVCQSKSAYAYHSYQCRGLARCTHTIVKMTKAQAVKFGYKPCQICYR